MQCQEGECTSRADGTGSSMSLISDAARWKGAGARDSCCSLCTAALTALALAPAPWPECIKQHLQQIMFRAQLDDVLQVDGQSAIISDTWHVNPGKRPGAGPFIGRTLVSQATRASYLLKCHLL